VTNKVTSKKAINILLHHKEAFELSGKTAESIDLAITALKKQEQSCDTCRHGRFGSEACIKCRVRFPSHYEAEEES